MDMSDEKQKFLFVSITGLISDIAWQVAKEGHAVRYFIEDEKERDIADGFVDKVTDWEAEVDWADVIVFDDTLGQGELAQAAANVGKQWVTRLGRGGVRAVHGGQPLVVIADHHTFGGQPDVELDVIDPDLKGIGEAGQCVLGTQSTCAAMAVYLDAVPPNCHIERVRH